LRALSSDDPSSGLWALQMNLLQKSLGLQV
jgi:hypothetical protein